METLTLNPREAAARLGLGRAFSGWPCALPRGPPPSHAAPQPGLSLRDSLPGPQGQASSGLSLRRPPNLPSITSARSALTAAKAAGDPVSLSPLRRRVGRTPIHKPEAYRGWVDAGVGKARQLGPCDRAGNGGEAGDRLLAEDRKSVV